jgi:hypothetical protein
LPLRYRYPDSDTVAVHPHQRAFSMGNSRKVSQTAAVKYGRSVRSTPLPQELALSCARASPGGDICFDHGPRLGCWLDRLKFSAMVRRGRERRLQTHPAIAAARVGLVRSQPTDPRVSCGRRLGDGHLNVLTRHPSADPASANLASRANALRKAHDDWRIASRLSGFASPGPRPVLPPGRPPPMQTPPGHRPEG